MTTRMEQLVPSSQHYDEQWPKPLLDAWTSVTAGTQTTVATRRLWPHYAHRVRAYLLGHYRSLPERAAGLSAAMEIFLNHLTAGATP